MAGSWEIADSNQVLIGILHTETTSVSWSFGLRNLIVPGQNEFRRFDPFCMVAGQPFDMARNTICYRALEVGATHIFFLDSDVIPPRDAILRLMRHNLPIVSGMYCRRSPPHAVPVMIKNGGWFIPPRLGGLVDVELVGAGCLLIKTDLLREMVNKKQTLAPGNPFFWWAVNQKGIIPDGQALSEDFTLCQRLRSMGHKIWVDTSIQCKHVGLAQAGLQKYEPCEMATMT